MKKSKYGSRNITIQGERFDSQKEANRYRELLLLQRAGKINELRRQVEFELIPTQREPDTIGTKGGIKKGNILERRCCYKADFVYKKGDETIVEDTKGVRTKDYIIKRKLMLYVHGIRILES